MVVGSANALEGCLVSAFLSGYDTCIALLFNSGSRDSLLFQVVVVDGETMQRYIPNAESEQL
jgi:hypothetical protein